MLAVAVAALLLQFSATAQAFECPKHFAEAQAAIEKVTESINGMEGKMSKDGLTLVQSHILVQSYIVDAKMALAEAKFHHEIPEGLYHHAHAIARANAARGHALAAVALHDALMK
jgi:hypothetical protein